MVKYKLICFDVDGTLIDNIKFSWQLFHDHFKTDEKEREGAKQSFMKGDISYLQWAEHDIGMWKNKKVKKKDFFDAIEKRNIKLMDGTLEALKELKKRGFKLAIISGSINVMVEKFIPQYEEIFDDIFISKIDFDEEGDIIGIRATEYDMEHKATALKMIAKKEGLDLSECVFVGDYLNDMQVIKDAGLGIAFNCKEEELKKIADVVIEKNDLREVLKYIL